MDDVNRPVDVQIGDSIVRVPRRRRIETPPPFIGPPLPPHTPRGPIPPGSGLVFPPAAAVNNPLPMDPDEVGKSHITTSFFIVFHCPVMADPGVQTLLDELTAQKNYQKLRYDAYSQYGKKLPRSRKAYASQLLRKQRSAARRAQGYTRSRLTDSYVKRSDMNYPYTTDYATLNDIIGRGRYRRRRRRMRRGAYYASQVSGAPTPPPVPASGGGSYFTKALGAARKGASWVRKHQKELKAVGMAINPEMTMATDAYLKRTGAGVAAAKMLGRGAYNSLFPIETAGQLTELDSVESEHGNLIVTGQEKIADIFGNDFKTLADGSKSTTECVPFTSFTVDLTPGNFEQFPKLAQHAANWKEYEWVSLIFTYKSTLPQNWQTTDVTTGKVIMATEYNLKKPVWTTHGELAAQEQKVEGPVTGITKADRCHYLGVECDPKMMTTRALKFVRTKGLTPDEDQQDYDLGRTSFGLFGTNPALANQLIGELWVTYQVHFKTHRQYVGLGYNIPQSIKYNHFINNDTGTALQWTMDGTNSPPWLQLFNFAQSGISRELCYNNIDFLLQSSQLNWGDATKRWYGIALEIIFPSSLKGNYEVEATISGYNLMPADGAVDPDVAAQDFGFSGADTQLIHPVTTGTCLLNSDFPIQGPDTTQASTYSVFSGRKVTIRVHIHLEQATSVENNSLKFRIPLIQQAAASAVAPNLYNAGGAIQIYQQTALSIKQYNSFQNLGETGLPYKDTVSQLAVTI